MYDRENLTHCEEIDEHTGQELVSDTDGVLIYRCEDCGAEWWEDEEGS